MTWAEDRDRDRQANDELRATYGQWCDSCGAQLGRYFSVRAQHIDSGAFEDWALCERCTRLFDAGRDLLDADVRRDLLDEPR